MNTLNIINKSPFEKSSLIQCLERLGEGDSILLIEDAIVAAVNDTTFSARLSGVSGTVSLYVLWPDLAARGFDDASLIRCIETVDYVGFVGLVERHARVHSWL